MNMFSDIFCFDWYQICNNLNLRITERRRKIVPANFYAKWAAVSCVTSMHFVPILHGRSTNVGQNPIFMFSVMTKLF